MRIKIQDTRHKVQNLNHQNIFSINPMSQELEDRFFKFAENTRDFCLKVKWDIINREYISQLIRSSASVGANYIEASDSLGVAKNENSDIEKRGERINSLD